MRLVKGCRVCTRQAGRTAAGRVLRTSIKVTSSAICY